MSSPFSWVPHIFFKPTPFFQAWIIPPDFDHSEAEAKVKELLCKHLFNMHPSALGIRV